MNKYEHWNSLICEELCDHFKAFDECRDYDNLCMIEKLAKTAVALGEMEAIGAMRDYAESEFGYDSETGGFKGRMREPMYAGIYNATGMPKTMRTIAGQYPTTTSTYGGSMRSTDGDWGRDYDRGEDSQYGDRTGRMGRQGMRNGYNGETGMTTYRGIYNAADMEEAKKHMKLTNQQIEDWMENLVNDDGSVGPEYDVEQTDVLAKKLGIEFKNYTREEFNAVVNMLYSDMCSALKVNGQEAKPETWAKMAKAWLEDEDGLQGSHRLAVYYHNIID